MRPMGRIQEFLVSSSGSVSNRSAAGVGWLAFAVGALAAVLGTSSRASADDCYGIPLWSCSYRCQSDQSCQYSTPAYQRFNRICHWPGDEGCEVEEGECGCP